MSYNGYTNEESYLFDVVWTNDRPLYEAIVSEGKRLLVWLPGMTDQTLGLNVLNDLRAMLNDGGWGWRSCPDAFTSVPASSRKNLAESCGQSLPKIDETEFGANIRDAVGVECASREAPEPIIMLYRHTGWGNPDMREWKVWLVNERVSFFRDGEYDLVRYYRNMGYEVITRKADLPE